MNRNILYVDSYGTGSHLRMAHLLDVHSRHEIRTLLLGPEHWRWRYLAAHHELAPEVNRLAASDEVPDLIVLAGPMSVAGFITLLESALQEVPRVRYIHESQWTYPTRESDISHFLVADLEAVLLTDESWFNSAYHRQVFYNSAIDHSSRRVRQLARQILPHRWSDTATIYPPVSVEESPPTYREKDQRDRRRIVWAARWEEEKRPEVFVDAIQLLSDRRRDFDIALLSPGQIPDRRSNELVRRIAPLIAVPGPLEERTDYEAALCAGDVFVSTADHEFFGMAAIEAAMLDATPVLPYALAYPETLPSAWYYRHHDVKHLVSVLDAALDADGRCSASSSDALRFAADRTVPEFDDAVERLLLSRSC